MQSIKWHKLLPWIAKYPADSFGQRVKILFDYIRLFRRKRLTREEYYEFEFERRGEEFRNDFLGWVEQGLYLKTLNPIKYYTLSRNKFLTHRVLEGVGVRKAELLCFYQPEGRVEESDVVASTVADVCRILQQKQARQCVIKETENSHGEGVRVVREIEHLAKDCRLHLFNGQSVLLSEVLGEHQLIFEQLVEQTAQFAGFNPSSVNTVRFMTTLFPDGSARIVAAFVKIGRAGNCVDNAGGGGNVDACVDVKSGEIRYAIQYDGWRNIRDIQTHPDSGAQLNGVVIDNWEQIKADVIRFQQAMPWCKAAGWDVAITDEGAVVVEVNDSWDRTGQYFIRRGWRREIRECYLAWRKVGYNPRVERFANRFSRREVRRLEKLFRN